MHFMNGISVMKFCSPEPYSYAANSKCLRLVWTVTKQEMPAEIYNLGIFVKTGCGNDLFEI